MRAHNWPGNVRELENLVRRLSALTVEDVVGADAVRLELQENNMEGGAVSREETGSLTESLNFHLTNYFKSHGDSLPPNGLYDRVLREVEMPLIELSLEATRGNQIKAAELLGHNRNTLRKKIQELDIKVVRSGEKITALGEGFCCPIGQEPSCFLPVFLVHQIVWCIFNDMAFSPIAAGKGVLAMLTANDQRWITRTADDQGSKPRVDHQCSWRLKAFRSVCRLRKPLAIVH